MLIKSRFENIVLSKKELKRTDFKDTFEKLLSKEKRKNNFKKAHHIIEKYKSEYQDTLFFNQMAADIYFYFKIIPAAKHYILQALKMEPENTTNVLFLSRILHTEGQTELAKQVVEKAFASTKDFALCHKLADYYFDEGDFALSHAMRQLIVEHDPSVMHKIVASGYVPVLYDSENHATKCIEKLDFDFTVLSKTSVPQKDIDFRAFPLALFYASYANFNQRNLNEKIAKTFRKIFPVLNNTAKHVYGWKPKKPGERINIAFASRFLSQPNHSVNLCYKSIVESLALDNFNVTVVSLADSQKNASYKFENVENLHFMNVENMYNHFNKTPQDILVYTDIGMEPYSYYSGFLRLAKHQCLMTGHPVTSGLDTIDYFISGDTFESPNARDHYTETLIGLKGTIVDYPLINEHYEKRNFQKESFGIKNDKNIYTCPMMIQKINPLMDDIFHQILKNDPDGVLVLFNNRAGWIQALLERFQNTMPDMMDRIYILKSLPLEEFHEFLKIADCVLDSYPFAGGNTSYQTLMNDRPIITWPSEYVRGRFTAGLYDIMGLSEENMGCVATSKDHFIEIANKTAMDTSFRNDVIDHIKTHKHKIFNNHNAADQHKEFFKKLAYGQSVQDYIL